MFLLRGAGSVKNRIFTRYLSDALKPASKPVEEYAEDSRISEISSFTPKTSETSHVSSGDSQKFIKITPEAVDDVILKNAASFDDVPGPRTLKIISKRWYITSIVGTQITASIVQFLLTIGSMIRRNRMNLFRLMLDEYGPVVRLHGLLGGDVVLISRPEHANIVFQNEGPYPIRSTLDCVEKYRLQHRKFKQAGPFVMYGPEWEKLRKTLEQPLQSSLSYYYEKIDTTSSELIARILSIRNKQLEMPKNFDDEIRKWSLECLCSVMFNKRIGFLDCHGLSSTSEPAILLESLNGATKAIKRCEYGIHLWKLFETPSWKSLVRHCDAIDNILTKYMRQAQDKLRERKKVCTVDTKVNEMSLLEFVLLKDNMEPEDMQTVLLDMMLIGVNTTSHAVAFLLYYLARYPRTQLKLYDELKNLPAKIELGTLTCLPYMKACLKESLRLQPPIPLLNRQLTRDIVVHGYRIPRNTHMLIATKLSSLREEYFDNAIKYKPERWIDQEVPKEMDSLATLPFGYGAKACVAKDLAEVEISLLIYKLLRKFRVEYHYGDIGSTSKLIASPNGPLRFRFIERT